MYIRLIRKNVSISSRMLRYRKFLGQHMKLLFLMISMCFILLILNSTRKNHSNSPRTPQTTLNSLDDAREKTNLHSNISNDNTKDELNGGVVFIEDEIQGTDIFEMKRNQQRLGETGKRESGAFTMEKIQKQVSVKSAKLKVNTPLLSQQEDRSLGKSLPSLDDDRTSKMYEEVVNNQGINVSSGKNYQRNSNSENSRDTIGLIDWVRELRAQTNSSGILRKRNLHWTIELAGQYNSRLYTPPRDEIPRQRLPQAIIIGAGHCGTRALIEFLAMHPNIVPSNREIHFFDRDDHFSKGYEWYKEQMPLSFSNQITIEKSPSYIWTERAIDEIYKFNKTIKLIVILKDPVHRLISMKLSHHPELIENMQMVKVDSVDQINYDAHALTHGVYVRYLGLWLQKYEASQILIIDGQDFETNPAKEIHKVESFLGVPHLITAANFYYNATKGFYCMRPPYLNNEIICLNNRKGREHPKLDPELERKLYDYYRGYNEGLFKLLGRRFAWDIGNSGLRSDNGNSYTEKVQH